MSNLLQDLTALGCGFVVEKVEQLPDPEDTLIQALETFWFDKKIFTMMMGLLRFRIHTLVNTQRLYEKSKNIETDKKIILIIVCLKIARATGDHRYARLAKKLKKPNMKLTRCPKQYADPFFVGRLGVDKDFKKFKVSVADFFNFPHEKKFKSIENIYSENLWLRLRALIGPDYRADVIYLKHAGLVNTQAEAAKVIGCDKSSTSRIWNSIYGLDALAQFSF